MKKSRTAFLSILTAVLLLALSTCGVSASTETSESSEPAAGEEKLPAGLYMLEYYCDETGEYVPELNEITDYEGYATTELQQLYNEKKTYWYEISEDHTGTYHGMGDVTYELSFEPAEGILWLDDIFYDYHYDADSDAFWYGGDDLYSYMRACTQEELDYISEGKGGSVPADRAEVGDLVCLGNYETYPYNEETEPLFWRVIDKQDGKLLILCDKLIDSFSFNYDPDLTNSDADKVTWENCSLREFLNNEFLEMMFTEEERALIQTTTNENKAANEELLAQWGTFEDRDGIPYSEQTFQNKADDPDTEDNVFLLSYQEVLKYFGEPTEEYAGGSDYPFTEMKANPAWKAMVTKAVDENAIGYFDTDTRYGAWMTRTLSTAGNEPYALVTYITSEGQVVNYYTYDRLFIRPAMWINATP